MTELDTFERSLESAFRAFADRGVTEVDAAEFSERVARRARRPRAWLARPRPSGRLATIPAMAWTLLLAGLLLVLLAGLLVAGAGRPDPAPTLMEQLAGTWTYLSGDAKATSVTIGDCAVRADCGSVTVVDGGACDYPLAYRSGTRDGGVFDVGDSRGADADRFRCGWSMWPKSTMELALDGPGTLTMTISHGGGAWASAQLIRVVDGILPEILAGRWTTATGMSDPRTLTLTGCAVGATCGTYTYFDPGLTPQEACEYALTYSRASGDAFVFAVGPARTFGCAWIWRPDWEVSIVPLAQDALELSSNRASSGSVTLQREDGAAWPAAPAPTRPEPAGSRRQ